MTALPPQPLSPLGGPVAAVIGLGDHLSEAGLNRARVQVEVEWLIYLTEHRMFGSSPLTPEQKHAKSRWRSIAKVGRVAPNSIQRMYATSVISSRS